MKKLSFSIFFCCFFSITCFAQFGQKGWVPYFPAQENMVGRICTGAKNSPLCTEPTEKVEVQKSESFADLTTYQKKTLVVKFGELFNSNSTKVRDIKATNVYVDTVTSDFLVKADRGVQFVYSALRADTVNITITKDTKIKANAQEIAAKLATVLPPNVPIDKIKEFLPEDIEAENKASFVIKITKPEVYFMIQRARIDIKDMKSLLGTENVLIFGTAVAGQCNYTDNNTILNQAEPQTCALTVPVSGTGRQIKMVLEQRDNKLYIVHNSANRPDEIRTEIKEYSQGRWLSRTGQMVYRYPFQTTGDKIKYKEIYLYIDAIKDGENVNITRKAGNKNFPTRISYPNSELTLID